MVVAAGSYVVPRWYDGDRTAVTADANAPYRAASSWLRTEVEDPEDTRVLVDDGLWLDLVHDGYRPGLGAIWFYKADLDPAVTKTMPRGWKDLDYVVASPTVRRRPSTPATSSAGPGRRPSASTIRTSRRRTPW